LPRIDHYHFYNVFRPAPVIVNLIFEINTDSVNMNQYTYV